MTPTTLECPTQRQGNKSLKTFPSIFWSITIQIRQQTYSLQNNHGRESGWSSVQQSTAVVNKLFLVKKRTMHCIHTVYGFVICLCALSAKQKEISISKPKTEATLSPRPQKEKSDARRQQLQIAPRSETRKRNFSNFSTSNLGENFSN